MSTAGDPRPYSSRFIAVVCPCGRALRAPFESAGSTIQCWQCRAAVPVPVPRPPRQITTRILANGLGDFFTRPVMTAWLIATVALTVMLALPVPGLWLTGAILAFLAVGYGLVISWDSLPLGGKVATVLRAILTLPVAMLPALPWLLLGNPIGSGRPPLLTQQGILAGALLGAVVPILLVAIWAPSALRALGSLARHPVSTVLALVATPVGIALAEAVVVLAGTLTMMFTFFLVDMSRGSEQVCERFKVDTGANYQTVFSPERAHLAVYGYYLGHGLPMSLTLPATLGVPHIIGENYCFIDMDNQVYFVFRLVHVVLGAGVWIFTLMLQARLLGLVARLDTIFDVRATGKPSGSSSTNTAVPALNP